jgi:hypothetical protein
VKSKLIIEEMKSGEILPPDHGGGWRTPYHQTNTWILRRRIYKEWALLAGRHLIFYFFNLFKKERFSFILGNFMLSWEGEAP